MKHVFLDTETTGLKVVDGNRIVEIMAITYENRKPVKGSDFYSCYNPECEMEPGAQKNTWIET